MTDQEKENLTINVRNEEIEEFIDTYLKENTPQHLNQLVVKLRTSRILVPASLNEEKKPVPCLLPGPENTSYFPLYTSKEHIPAKPKSELVLNLPFLAANHMVEQHIDQIDGIAINPFTQNLVFKRALVEQIAEAEKKLKDGGQKKKLELTPEQYIAFERKEFEFGHFPKKFFEQGKEMIDKLFEEKETYIDGLFESCYQHQRMYPYLTEEFSIMPLNLTEDILLVQIDMPEQGMEIPSCYRIYLSWDVKQEKGRYFTVERTKEDNKWLVGEMEADFKHTGHGEIPAGGAEMQKIVELLEIK